MPRRRILLFREGSGVGPLDRLPLGLARSRAGRGWRATSITQTMQPLFKPSFSERIKTVATSARFLLKQKTTLNNGYLGSRNDEERSEMRYVV